MPFTIDLEKPPKPKVDFPIVPIIEPIVFDGKAFASHREKIVASRVADLATFGITPKLAIVITTDDPASQIYVRMKQKACERVGIICEVYQATRQQHAYKYIIDLLGMLNSDNSIHGLMIQLPFRHTLKLHQEKLLNMIPPHKDVDGLRSDTTFTPATVRAIDLILEHALRQVATPKPKILVLGNKGVVGAAVQKHLSQKGYVVDGIDKGTKGSYRPIDRKWGIPSFVSLKQDVLISCTGSPGLVTHKNIKVGAIVIDVGSPVGDVRFKEAQHKASFITPVPGGVGPVTVSSLLENLIDAVYSTLSEQNT